MAAVFQLASLTDVYWTLSGQVVLMTLPGGMGTVFARSWALRSSSRRRIISPRSAPEPQSSKGQFS
jgi:hypothetical protein